MKNKKAHILRSALTLLLCISLFVGSTFAWFTDSVQTKGNIIQSGSLDLEMYWTDDLESGEWYNVETSENKTIFDYEKWEPGYTSVRYIKLKNAGNLALNYKLAITPEGAIGKLAEVIQVYCANDGVQIENREDLQNMGVIGLLKTVLNGGATVDGTLLPAGKTSPMNPSDETIITLAMSMITTAGNEYQDEDAGSFSITAIATQASFEQDSYGANYDSNAEYPVILRPGIVTADVKNVDGAVAEAASLVGEGIAAYVPAGVALEEDAQTLTLQITPKESSESNITVVNNEIIIPLDVHIDGVSEDNEVPIVIELGEVLPKYLNMGNYLLYHIEDGVNVPMQLIDDKEEFTAHNQFKYDPYTGKVTVAMASFSELTLVADTVNAWDGGADYTWYDASKTEYEICNADQLDAFAKIVGGMVTDIDQDSFTDKTVKLLSDINIGDAEADNTERIFHPIGYYYTEDKNADGTTGDYYSTVNSFEGTFDGNGHTITGIYQNTWEIKGDYDANYYNDAMGLFGYVLNGTVKNLTVDHFSSDGEFTPTGVIAAYADGESVFSNIAITNCNPRVYNTGNGGIIGIAGNSNGGDKITLENITVDNSNKISALWGSWDVACGGLVGMFRGNDKGSTISFNNCHVAAQIDVYNDVCANYQYYAYRYAGMIIGSVRNNTTNAEGKTIPNMTGISATGCTVNYGDWNDYYYCEFVKNSPASYSEDYQFSRVDKNEITFDENGNVTGCTHTHTAEEDKTAVYLPFHQLFTGYSWGVSSIGLEQYGGIAVEGDYKDIVESDQNESVEKFERKFTGDFLYRVGNGNAVSVGTLFGAAAKLDENKEPLKNDAGEIIRWDINDTGVVVTIDKVDEDSNVSGTFTASTTDWAQGTIQFTGTGVVKVTIQDYQYCEPTVMYLEVVDAVNATSATSATKNNVVLLNDCSFSSITVSDGYALYGNGFTMTCGSDSVASDMGYGFVTLNNGTLDNVQIVCPNFDYAALYKSNLTSDDNRSYTTEAGKTSYYNARSGVMASGNSQILNSRISGARAAVNVAGGNVVIDNSQIELGAVASILVGAANSVTLRDVTLVQRPTASTYDTSKSLMGFSVLFVCDANGDAAPVTLEGTIIQNAWVDENDKQYVPSAGQSIISTVLAKTEYLHDVDGDGTNESLNLGFAYMPESLTSAVNTTTITDNRTDKDTVPYDYAEVSILNGKTYVYSYKNTNGTSDSYKTESEYKPNEQSDIITVTYADTADGLTTGKSYSTDGWIYELNVDLDKLSGYALDFSKLSMNVNGVSVNEFNVNGSAKPTSPVAVVAGGVTYTLTATVNGTEYTATYKVTGTETSKESPSLVASNYEEGLCVASSYGGTWSGAAPALEGIQIKYWSVAEKQYKTITLSDYTPTTAGKQNGTNTTWTYSPDNGDFTLTLTGGQVHSGNSVNAMPVVCDGKLYFVAASSNGLVNTGNSARTIPVSYSFKDNNNGDELTFSHTWSVAENTDAQYKYSDFCNGTLTKLEESSDSGCVTPDTLITLADGTQKRVDSLTGEEQLLVWNLKTGAYDAAPIVFVDSEAEEEYEIIHLYFSDGSDVKVISEHGFFDVNLGEYVYIDANNYADYIGHKFVKEGKIARDTWKTVKLEEVVIEKEVTTAWSPVTFEHLCYYTNGILSMPGGIDGLFNIFEVNTRTMRYDAKQMEADIETYGLFTFEDFEGLIPEEAFAAFNGQYLKVAIGKALLTWEDIYRLAERYVPLMK